MKKYTALAALALVGVISVSQTQDVMTVKMKDGTIHTFKVEEVNEVIFQTKEPEISYLLCPNDNHPHLIDLGLPSGTKWACCNVGATAPEEFGGYYSWGEADYYDGTYSYYNEYVGYFYLGYDIAGTQYDVAHVKWDGSWRMPSAEQIKELLKNCSWNWTNQNGVSGMLVTGSNGGTIFLPASGYYYSIDGFEREGKEGRYWSSTPNETKDGKGQAVFLKSTSSGLYVDYRGRSYGHSVRAVCPYSQY